MGKKAGRGTFISFTVFLLISFLMLISMSCSKKEEATTKAATEATAGAAIQDKKTNPDNFLTLYPGVYTEKEKALAEKYIADNKALEARGCILQDIIKGTITRETPGFGNTIKATETMVRYFNGMRDPENPIYNNADYARKLGYQDIIAYPAFAAHDDSFMVPYPPKARDTLLVADLIHSNTFYRPVYPGDTLYLINNSRTVKDQTPEEGSIYRSIALSTNGSIYNQRGEKVMDVKYTVQENIKVYKEGLAPENPGFADFWEEWKSGEPRKEGSAPAGEEASANKIYYYTDEDWKTIKDIWSKEKVQGSTPLYWEDVKIGDQPAWTLEGPLDSGISVAVPWGMGLGGNRSLKKKIMDPELFKTLVRDQKDGIYRPADLTAYIPAIPAEARTGQAFGEMGEVDAELGGSTEKPVSISYGGAGMMNFARRDLAIRHINNWIGEHGWLYNIRWGGLYSADMISSAYGKPHPAPNPDAVRFLDKVPRDLIKTSSASGVRAASFIMVKSYVYNKFVQDGEFFADIAWWIEAFPSGSLWGSGGATVKLPSKNAK
jgi:acyl dehydratase